MKKTILFFVVLSLLTISCSRNNNDDDSNQLNIENTIWSGILTSSELKIMTNNVMDWDNEKVQIQFKEKSTFKLYGYGKNSQNQWIVNSGPYNGTYTFSPNGAIKLNYESGATFRPLNIGNISGSIMTLKIGDSQFKFNKD